MLTRRLQFDTNNEMSVVKKPFVKIEFDLNNRYWLYLLLLMYRKSKFWSRSNAIEFIQFEYIFFDEVGSK